MRAEDLLVTAGLSASGTRVTAKNLILPVAPVTRSSTFRVQVPLACRPANSPLPKIVLIGCWETPVRFCRSAVRAVGADERQAQLLGLRMIDLDPGLHGGDRTRETGDRRGDGGRARPVGDVRGGRRGDGEARGGQLHGREDVDPRRHDAVAGIRDRPSRGAQDPDHSGGRQVRTGLPRAAPPLPRRRASRPRSRRSETCEPPFVATVQKAPGAEQRQVRGGVGEADDPVGSDGLVRAQSRRAGVVAAPGRPGPVVRVDRPDGDGRRDAGRHRRAGSASASFPEATTTTIPAAVAESTAAAEPGSSVSQ